MPTSHSQVALYITLHTHARKRHAQSMLLTRRCPVRFFMSLPIRVQIDRRSLLENLALVLLAMDELIDAGKILEIDPSAIANRVLMRGADARQPLASELTVQQVLYGVWRDRTCSFPIWLHHF